VTFLDVLKVCVTVIGSVGGGGAIVFGLSGYLGKLWADRALESQRRQNARALEQQRQEYAQLNLEFNHQLRLVTERTKNALEIATLEHQVRFSRLHEKRAKAIEGIDKLAYELQREATRYTQDFGRGGRDAYEQVVRKIYDFDDFCESHRIYLSADMERSLYSFLKAVREPVVAIRVYGDFGTASHETIRQHREVILEALKAATENVPALRGTMIKEFRSILDGTQKDRLEQ
jgi:hypothetical protein